MPEFGLLSTCVLWFSHSCDPRSRIALIFFEYIRVPQVLRAESVSRAFATQGGAKVARTVPSMLPVQTTATASVPARIITHQSWPG